MDSLRRIISRLSEEEIETIRKHLSSNDKESTLLLILDFYLRKNNKSKLSDVLNGKVRAASIPPLKNRLKELILDQVRMVNPKSVYSEFYKLLDHIEWLSRNNLYEEAKFYIQKLHVDADLQDFRFFYGAAGMWIYNAIDFSNSKTAYEDKLQAINQIEKKYLEEINGFKISKFNFLVSKLFNEKQLPNDYNSIKQLEELKKHDVFKMDASNPILNHWECRQIVKSKSLIYMGLGDDLNSYKQAMIFYERLKRDIPLLKESSLQDLFWGLQYVLEAIMRANDPKKYKEIIDLSFELLDGQVQRNKDIYLRLLAHNLKYYSSFGSLKELELALEKVIPEVDNTEGKSTSYTIVDVDFLVVQILFKIGRYSEAIKRNDNILDYTKGTKNRYETQQMAKVLDILIQFSSHLKNANTVGIGLTSQAERLRRYFEKKTTVGNYKLEIAILRFIEKFGSADSREKRIKYLEDIEKKFSEIVKKDGPTSSLRVKIYQVERWPQQCISYINTKAVSD